MFWDAKPLLIKMQKGSASPFLKTHLEKVVSTANLPLTEVIALYHSE